MGDQGLKAPDLIHLRRLKCKSYNIQSFFTAYLHFYSHTGKSHFPVTFELPMYGFSVTVLFYGILSMSCLSPCLSLTCVASVSVRFRRKQRGTRVKDRAKNGISKRAGGGGEERKETLADKPRDFENHPLALACHAWVRAPTFDAVINCHNWPIKCLAFSGAEINFRGPVCETKIIFFCILERVDGVHGEISMNPNDPSPPLSPSFTFWLSFHFSRGQYRKSPSLGISLLRNQTETLATQASLSPAPARFSHFFLLNDFPPLSRSLEQANSHTGKSHFPVTFDIWCCQRVTSAWRPAVVVDFKYHSVFRTTLVTEQSHEPRPPRQNFEKKFEISQSQVEI